MLESGCKEDANTGHPHDSKRLVVPTCRVAFLSLLPPRHQEAGEGFITTKVLKEILKELDSRLSDQDIDEIIEDIHEDGKIDFTNFKRLML
ncbi:EF-hand domain pair [Trinorchestia longiramus]|nr:EF-hand domain pair [Trinorchestia longiramus]